MSQDTSNGSVPFYLPIGDEVDIFRAAYECRLPVLLKGPTGCGKTRFVEHMAHILMSDRDEDIPENIVTVACHEDLTGSDLVGRYLIKGDDTVWVDGPLTQAVRTGAICYLDEIVEARKDTIVLIHPLTDHRRILPIDKKTERRGERGIWQRRYWEHLIRDQADFDAHVDYIHFNPVKHGHVDRVRDWRHSSFHAYARAGMLPADWGGDQRDLPVQRWGATLRAPPGSIHAMLPPPAPIT